VSTAHPQSRVLVIEGSTRLLDALRAAPDLAQVAFETCPGGIEAVRELSRRAYDVVITSAQTSVEADLSLLVDLRRARPGIRVIVLAPERQPEDVLSALRADVFACFDAPFDLEEIARMTASAVEAHDWRKGIELLSAKRDWIQLRVNCRRLEADRLTHFMTEIQEDLDDSPHEQLLVAFREVLLNAMEHGAGFDPEKVIEVAAIRTARTIVYYFNDAGPGFRLEEIAHAAVANPPDDPLAHMERREAAGMRPGGFGLLVAKRIVDEMMFNEAGNAVLLIKHTA
jgi:DNA-binding response OmpR family regulator